MIPIWRSALSLQPSEPAERAAMSDDKTPEGPDFSRGVPVGDLAEGAMLAGRVGEDAVLVARVDGALFAIGAECIVMQNAVLRATARHSLAIGRNCLIGPNSHVVGCRVEEQKVQAQRIAREREHPAQLASTDNTYRHALLITRGSGVSRTVAVCLSRNASRAVATAGYLLARMEAAQTAALVAPATPIANVATGMPAGICTVDSSESIPFSDVEGIGTPITGRIVCAAMTPARCAAPPAPAMITRIPRSAAFFAKSALRSGERCADVTSIS